MQKDIGAVMGLYPTPTTICGTVLEDGRVNWIAIAHVGVVEHGHLLVSIGTHHELTDAAISKNKTVSVSLVNQDMLVRADYCGIAKAASTDKSGVFAHHFDDVEGAPIIDEAPLCMTCRVVDMIEIGKFHDYILEPVHTYVQEEYITEDGKIDYAAISPVLFEFSSAQYLSCGKVIGKCWDIGKAFKA
ncbi:MAG: flavin reductase family protein [Coriobacteriales bacterium]|jgi:flavin reductase (DIM6/NTAB) family NADH-FMN oxidoreductase RutF